MRSERECKELRSRVERSEAERVAVRSQLRRRELLIKQLQKQQPSECYPSSRTNQHCGLRPLACEVSAGTMPARAISQCITSSSTGNGQPEEEQLRKNTTGHASCATSSSLPFAEAISCVDVARESGASVQRHLQLQNNTTVHASCATSPACCVDAALDSEASMRRQLQWQIEDRDATIAALQLQVKLLSMSAGLAKQLEG